MTPPRITTARRVPDNVVRENDYVTMAQCAKIAAGMAERMIAEHDRARRDARWYRRLVRWLWSTLP